MKTKQNLINNDSGQTSPIMVVFVVMTSIIGMALLMLFIGSFMDVFLHTVADFRASNPLSAWGDSMMNALPLKYAPYVFFVSGAFILIILVWGIKTVIKNHEYSKKDAQYISDGDEY